MLTLLHIRHFTIIDDTTLELDAGMTALTGETGAGKSILLDALGLVLGDRAPPQCVQRGAERAVITAHFELDSLPAVRDWLVRHDIDSDDECLLRRIITAGGKSRASINGHPVTLALVRELGQQLVSIHGQQSHLPLLRPAHQREVLDAIAGAPAARLLDRLAAAHAAWQAAREALHTHEAGSQQRAERADLLQFQLQEFESLDIGGLQIADIENEHRWLANAEQLAALGQRADAALDADGGAQQALQQAIRALQDVVRIDERLQEALDLIESADIQTREALRQVRHHVSALEQDSGRLQWLDSRLAIIHSLCRKHRCEPAALGDLETALRDELDALQSPEADSESLRAACASHHQTCRALADKLTTLRRRSARQLSATVTETMQTLGMTGGRFEITVHADADTLAAHGQDQIAFLVSANPGIEPAPLARVASGGELSRIGLCLQMATVGANPVPTLIFDEVDAGVGGAIATRVGQLLRRVGSHAQVLCVTHLPQVAAMAHQHLHVSKHSGKRSVSTELAALSGAARRDEIARMLGAERLTAKSRQHAQELLDSAEA